MTQPWRDQANDLNILLSITKNGVLNKCKHWKCTLSLNTMTQSSLNIKKDYTAIFYRATHLRKLKYKVKFYMKVECPIKMTKVVSHHSKHTENKHTCKQLLLQNPCSGHYWQSVENTRWIKCLNSRKSRTIQSSSLLFGYMLLQCVRVIKDLASGKFQCIHTGQFCSRVTLGINMLSSTKSHTK